jgi:hypothetical protein
MILNHKSIFKPFVDVLLIVKGIIPVASCLSGYAVLYLLELPLFFFRVLFHNYTGEIQSLAFDNIGIWVLISPCLTNGDIY